MATTLSSLPQIQSRVAAKSAAVTSLWHAYTAVFAAACVMIGVYWDISWHMTIGRDSFWTPAHLAIQLGGIIAGTCGAYVIIGTTLGRLPLRDSSVSVWGFRAPLGAFVAVWGAAAMVISAPF